MAVPELLLLKLLYQDALSAHMASNNDWGVEGGSSNRT